jgi:hypothetical protein
VIEGDVRVHGGRGHIVRTDTERIRPGLEFRRAPGEISGSTSDIPGFHADWHKNVGKPAARDKLGAAFRRWRSRGECGASVSAVECRSFMTKAL